VIDVTEIPYSESPKEERIGEFFQRLARRRPFASFDEAWAGLAAELHQVEDELSGIPRHPNGPTESPYDGRIYPPHTTREKPDVPGVRSFRQKAHRTSFAENGAIEIVAVKASVVVGEPVFEKAGADRRRVADFRSAATEDEEAP
jgi:hypothetical protein